MLLYKYTKYIKTNKIFLSWEVRIIKKEVRVFPLEKYMEFITDESLIENKYKFLNIPKDYVIGIDLSLDVNLFYGLKIGNTLYKSVVNIKEFDNYDVVLRLLSWGRWDGKGEYVFRVLKSNKNEQVDFQEEKDYLNSHKVCCNIK